MTIHNPQFVYSVVLEMPLRFRSQMREVDNTIKVIIPPAVLPLFSSSFRRSQKKGSPICENTRLASTAVSHVIMKTIDGLGVWISSPRWRLVLLVLLHIQPFWLVLRSLIHLKLSVFWRLSLRLLSFG